MLRVLTAKIGGYLLVLWIAVTLNFVLPRLLPGNPLTLLAGEEANLLTAAQRHEVLAAAGLDQPLPVQYGRYLAALLHGDFGYSYQYHRPIAAVLADRLPWTLLLTGSGLLLATLLGTSLGAWAAWRRGGRRDLGLLTLFMVLESLPAFWVGILLVALFAVQWPLFPTFGGVTAGVPLTGMAYIADVGRHLVLPLLTLTLASISGPFLIARAALLGVLGEEYLMVARAKGLAERQILFRHALRNALLPITTVFALNLAFAFGGATVVETVFSYPGIGRLIYEAVLSRDYPVLQAAFLLITLLVIAANVLADLAYPLLDPRVRQAGFPAAGPR